MLLSKAFKEAASLSNDSLKSKYLARLSLLYYRLDDSINFREVNRKAIEISKSVGDSVNLGEVYWDLAYFFKRHNIQDSAYLQFRETQQLFEKINDQVNSGIVLRNMAAVQSEIGNYAGSEATVIRAIKKLKPLKKYRDLARCYALLADNAKLLDDPERALTHYSESLGHLQEANASPSLILSTQHNIALVYQNKHSMKRPFLFLPKFWHLIVFRKKDHSSMGEP